MTSQGFSEPCSHKQTLNLQNNSYYSPLRYWSLLITTDWARRSTRIKRLLSTTISCFPLGLQPDGMGLHPPFTSASQPNLRLTVQQEYYLLYRCSTELKPHSESRGKLPGQGEAGWGSAASSARSRRSGALPPPGTPLPGSRSCPGSSPGARLRPAPRLRRPATARFPMEKSCHFHLLGFFFTFLKIYSPFAPSPDRAL